MCSSDLDGNHCSIRSDDMSFMIKFMFYTLGVLFVADAVASFSLALAVMFALSALFWGMVRIGDANA